MADVPESAAGWGDGGMFAKSEWFTRGWTLQELIAPVSVEFYAKNWEPIGTKLERHREIAVITLITQNVLTRTEAIDLFSTAEKLSWASHRQVTREEDEAYSLLGLFDVNMPLLYGEGREKAFVRLQEAIYNSTADHSIFLFRYSLHDDSQPLLADSPTRFCERSDCSSCLSLGMRCLPLSFRYGKIVASEMWSTQAHEQIMTTVTMFRNEMSTVLPLLDYRDVSDKLVYFDNDKPGARVTHVAVLNHTLDKYPQGALCLFLRRQPGQDASLRLPALPAVLPRLGDLGSKLQKCKLLICPGPSTAESNTCINTMFSVKSDLLHVETWDVKGSIGKPIPSTQASQNPGFEVQMRKPKSSRGPVEISCHLTGSQDPTLMLTIQLVKMDEIWSIEEVFRRNTGSKKRKQGNRERKICPLFLASTPADRCSIQLADGKKLSIGIRRLAGSARAHQEDSVLTIRYQITAALTDR